MFQCIGSQLFEFCISFLIGLKDGNLARYRSDMDIIISANNVWEEELEVYRDGDEGKSCLVGLVNQEHCSRCCFRFRINSLIEQS